VIGEDLSRNLLKFIFSVLLFPKTKKNVLKNELNRAKGHVFCIFDVPFNCPLPVEKLKNSGHTLGGRVYKCMMCGRMYEKLPEGTSGRLAACTCGSRVFIKARPQRVKRVRVV